MSSPSRPGSVPHWNALRPSAHRVRCALAGLALCVAGPLPAQGGNPLNLFLADIHWRASRPVIGIPHKLTHEGTNSQPSFTPAGDAIVFSGLRGSGPDVHSDIYRIDLRTGREARVTTTPENENSPTVNRAGGYFAVRWVEATLFKEYGLWEYAPDGTPLRGVLPGPDTTGYYLPLDNGDYALTRPKSRSTIAIFLVKTGSIEDVDSGVANLPAQRIPGERAISYTRIDSTGRNEIRRMDLGTHKGSTLGPALIGRTAHVWIPGHSTLLMARGNTLYARRVGSDTGWAAVASYDSPELRNLSAYAVSPRGDRLVLTSPLQPPLAVALRDSLEAGRPVQEVISVFGALRDRGKLSEYFVAEGSLLGVAGDSHLHHGAADEIALLEFTKTVFPSSHRVWARLGDALVAAKDPAGARTAYQKALELNPRSSPADRAAAERVERALKELGG